MALRISTHKNHRISSQMLNDRVNDVMGGNALISGFEVSIIAANQVKALAGKCIINGAIIEDDSPRVFAFDSIMLAQQETKLLIKYNHLEGTVTTHIRAWDYQLAENELLIGTAKLENNSVIEVIQAPYTVTLDGLNTLAESIEDKWSNSPNSVIETKEAKLEGTITGEVQNLTIKGQTYFNLVDEDNIERPVCGELVTAEACSHKITDSKSGAVNAVIAGRTLQNLLRGGFNGNVTSAGEGSFLISITDGVLTINGDGARYPSLRYLDFLFKKSTKYTLIVNVIELNVDDLKSDWVVFRLGEGDNKRNITVPNPTSTGLYVKSFVTPSDYDIVDVQTYGRANMASDKYIKLSNIMVLEGDHTNTPIEELPHIQGIQSVGDKIEKIFDGKLIIGRLDDNGQWYEDSVPTTSTEFIEISPGKSYIISKNGVAQQTNVFLYDENKNFIKRIFSSTGEFTATKTAKYVRFYWNRTTVELTDRIQVDEGNTVIPYEHYNKYNIEVKSVGKNLFNKTMIENNISIGPTGTNNLSCSDYIELDNHKTYVFSNNLGYHFEVYVYTENLIGSPYKTTVGPYDYLKPEINIPEGYKYIKFRTWSDENDKNVKVQIEEGTTITPYEPYQESTISHILNEPLRSLPDGVRDEVKDGKINRKVLKRVFDGSENWTINTEMEAKENTLLFDLWDNSNVKLIEYSKPQNNMCSAFLSNRITREYITANDVEGFCTVNKSFRIRVKKSRLSTQDVAGFKEFLKVNPVTVLCELATPIITPIDSDICLPNGVHDEVVDNKINKRIKKELLDANSSYWKQGSNTTDVMLEVWAYPVSDAKLIQGPNFNFICDRFESKDTSDTECIYLTQSPTLKWVTIRINKSRLQTPDVAGFKKWLALNPTTIWYELANPYTERTPIETPLSTFAGTTYITSKNVVMPKIKIDSVGTRYDVPLLKPGTGYTIKASADIKANLGGEQKTLLNGIAKLTTPATLTDKSLVLSGWGLKARDVMVFEGITDCHGYVEGIESVGNINGIVLPNAIKDELIGNEKMIQRTKKVCLDGSENWNQLIDDSASTLKFYIAFSGGQSLESSKRTNILCNNFIPGDFNKDNECVDVTDIHIRIRILRSKLETPDVPSFKKWLSENPTTVWYELAEPKEKTCLDWKVEVKSSNKNLFDGFLE